MILSRGTAQEPPWVWPEPSFAILSLVRLAFRVLPSTSSFPQGITSVWPSCGHCEGQRLKNEVHRVYAFLNGVGGGGDTGHHFPALRPTAGESLLSVSPNAWLL